MTNVRIVCTHDAAKTAQMLMRVLAAEGYNLDLSCGRGSLDQLERAVAAKEAVILIWSFDAPAAVFMTTWQKRVDPNFLVEVARAPGAPALPARRAPVIDFSSWRGERGGGAWRGLQERLRAVIRHAEPPRQVSPRAMIALGAASAVAVTGAFIIRLGDNTASSDVVAQKDALTLYDIDVGLGGPLTAVEPASEDDVLFGPLARRAEAIPAHADGAVLSPAPIAQPLQAREAQLLERLAESASTLIGEIRR